MNPKSRTVAPYAPSHAVILCHPDQNSFNASVASAYCEAIGLLGREAVLRDLYRMNFDPVLKSTERPDAVDFKPASDVAAEIEAIRNSEVFVLVYPIWFGTPPAMLKGYVERVLGAGFSHRAVRMRTPHSFLAGKHLLSITTSGTSLQWLNEQGAWVSLRNVFDKYLASAFSMASCEHLHLPNVVDGMAKWHVREELFRVTEFARQTCARLPRSVEETVSHRE